MQEKETTNSPYFSDLSIISEKGRILALDIGSKRVGAAISDELQISTRPLPVIIRKTWKELLKNVISMIEEFDAVALVLGLPLNMDGTETETTADVLRLARNFSLSLSIPVCSQDERLTSRDARENLHNKRLNSYEIKDILDSEAASIILSDFLDRKSNRSGL